MKRQAVGIWKCKACAKTVAGGAWTVTTTAAATVRRCVPSTACVGVKLNAVPSTVRRLRELTEA